MDKNQKFVELLLQYSKTHSLTNFNTPKAIMDNIEDSIYPKEQFKNKKRVLDVGSGAGFPAIALAIEYPEIEFVLCEPIVKKSSFLLLVKTILKLKNITVHSKKVEDITGKFDMIISRAVAKTTVMLDITKHLLTPSLTYLFYKGENAEEETKGIPSYIFANNSVRYVVIEAKDII